eukprot:TRINITY_DN61208_c0_g1_i1.p1 TRINITY_DN61208_c0_g1~~TRINITY_DN61208_c0_g1_i1.p1  ORF type:complete len:135 (+),score=22.37 TRINITY_DN61208_c0_g1_i1:34-405(+)
MDEQQQTLALEQRKLDVGDLLQQSDVSAYCDTILENLKASFIGFYLECFDMMGCSLVRKVGDEKADTVDRPDSPTTPVYVMWDKSEETVKWKANRNSLSGWYAGGAQTDSDDSDGGDSVTGDD